MQRVSFILEGETEWYAIPVLLRKLDSVVICKRVHIDGQEEDICSEDFVKRKIFDRLELVRNVASDKIVILLDREDRDDCPGQLAAAVLDSVRKVIKDSGLTIEQEIAVVICDRKFENWIIADHEGISKCKLIAKGLKNAVGQNSDSRNALAILKASLRPGESFRKTDTIPKLSKFVDITKQEVRDRSKSLSKFVRVVST